MTSCRLPATYGRPTALAGAAGPALASAARLTAPVGARPRFPACVNVTSALASIVWVYGPTKACFDPSVPGCVMPVEDGTNISQVPGAFPVDVTKIRESLHQASLTGEAWINSTRHGIPANATTVYLGAGATGASLGTLDRAGMTVRALEPGVEINSLALGAPDITLEGFTVANLTAVPDTPLRGLTLTSMRTLLPLRLSATPRRGVIDLDGAVLDTTTVAILRHTGTVVCKGTTLCVTLEGIDHRELGGTVRREDAAVVASIDKLTAVFGGAYTTEFIDDEDVYNGEAGAQLASDLAGWTAAAVVSLLLAHGDKLIGKNF